MILSLLLAAVTFAVVLPIILPLLRPKEAPEDASAFNRAVYRDQLAEVERDLARGLLTDTEATSARLEIQRRLLAAGRPVAQTPSTRGRRTVWDRAAACIAGVLMAGGAIAVYLLIGSPGLPDVPFAGRDHATASEGMELDKAMTRLGAELKAAPDNRDGWLLYARGASALRHWAEAADAYRHALAQGAGGTDVQSGYGEALTAAAQGIVGPDAKAAFDAALNLDPANPAARYYLAVALQQAGEPRRAIAALQALVADMPADWPGRPMIGAEIATAAGQARMAAPVLAPGRPAAQEEPTAAAIAGMPPAQQQAMIQSMVARLAQRMEDNPGDTDGWLRLGRAYAVLGQRDKAADAYGHAVTSKPDDPSVKLQALQGIMAGLKPSDPFPPGAPSLLRQLQTAMPEEPVVLWYLGLLDAHEGHTDQARQNWQKLLAKLPADGEDAGTVRAALGALRG